MKLPWIRNENMLMKAYLQIPANFVTIYKYIQAANKSANESILLVHILNENLDLLQIANRSERMWII